MRFAYCPATGAEPSEVITKVRINPPAAGQPAPVIGVVLDGEGNLPRRQDGSELDEEIARLIPDDPEIVDIDGRECEWRWRFDAERDAQGRMLLNMEKVAAVLPSHSRYNGGGVKQIERIDRSKTDGWSLIGEYCPSRANWCPPGLYLDISKSGSRANVNTNYQLFRLYADGTVACAGWASTTQNGKSWATALWPAVDRELAEIHAFGGPLVPAADAAAESSEIPVAGESENPAERTGDEDDSTIRAFVNLMRRLPIGEREHAFRVIAAAVIDGRCLDCGNEPGERENCAACQGTGRVDDLGEQALAGAV